MQPFPIPFEPTNLVPQLTIRSRRETNVFDTTNARLVEHWQTDAPSLTNSLRDIEQSDRAQDMNPTPSRLYREPLQRAPTYNAQGQQKGNTKKAEEVQKKVVQTLAIIQKLNQQLAVAPDQRSYNNTRNELATQKQFYQTLLAEQKQLQTDSLSQNPYFEKFDVAGDSRNVVRELRSAVTEDVVDRGVRESKKLLQREVESRWLPPNFAEDNMIDSLQAYDLMRPKINDNQTWYRPL
jgi:hypothetical protein